ncbi:hypothetical protein D7Z96_15435 [Pseudarthrobacter phenanthrenivorans]|uniref:Uncharacterized protein n=1 Tax=Pseudarthrobacter phenanthrenivorans TaxID=361575 RepID=A0A3B0FPS5_PSEPS|nr:hypothetical protein [Pseudarthrobacter phenanthrenivorans]RKO21850.1 hypothetical protein D7Z96_15435 [Pseudarthrobacter phenanthrenivorans]
MKSPEPACEGPGQCRQRPGKDHHSPIESGPGGPELSRRQIIDEGLEYILRYDAALLLRLADA